ncbi:hypothetical protein GCK32_022112, partial [Trichostrongylus colubriformis]
EILQISMFLLIVSGYRTLCCSTKSFCSCSSSSYNMPSTTSCLRRFHTL